MILKSIRKFLTETIPWVFFTNQCRYCGELLSKDEHLCKECSENLPVIKGEKCKYCGAEKSRCDCKKHKLGFDGITAPFYYENGIKACIHNFKFNRKIYLASILTEDMANTVKEDFGEKHFDLICFVPFSPIQKLTRYYNQSELLAEELSKSLKIPLERIMVKCFETKTQHTMSRRQRKGNVFGVYDIKNGADVKGKTILLVDDVKTSGSTLDDCAVILKIRGAKEVYCVTAAIAVFKRETKKDNEKATEGEQ